MVTDLTAARRSATIACALATACSVPSPSSRRANVAAPDHRLRVTPRVEARCGPDWLERHPTPLADLDGDGVPDRVSITREGGQFVVRLYDVPSFRLHGEWKLPDGYLELGTPIRRATNRGDLWIALATERIDAHTVKPNSTLYHLEGGRLVAVATDVVGARFGIDLDGDGRVDPIGSREGREGAWLGDRWVELAVPPGSYLFGAPLANGQQEAVDLEGDGARELIMTSLQRLAIVEWPSLRERWALAGDVFQPNLMRWGGAWVTAVKHDHKLKLYTTDASHAPIVEYADASPYSERQLAIDVAGRSWLVIDGVRPRLADRASPARGNELPGELLQRLGHAADPLGPVRVRADEPAGLVAMRRRPLDAFEIVVVDPATRAARRIIWSHPDSMTEMLDIAAHLIDLDGDGIAELLIDERSSIEEHHGFSFLSSHLSIVDGNGVELWNEGTPRSTSWPSHGDGAFRAHDEDAHVREMDFGDGTRALRVRSARDEYYVVAARSQLATIPACLE
jgi:hypothetical protein